MGENKEKGAAKVTKGAKQKEGEKLKKKTVVSKIKEEVAEGDEWVEPGITEKKKAAAKSEIVKANKKVETKEREPRLSPLRLAIWGIGLTVWVGVVLIAVQWILSFAIYFALIRTNLVDSAYFSSPEVTLVYQAVVYALCLAIIIFVPWKLFRMKTSREELGVEGLPTWTDILLGPIGFVLSMVFAMGAVALMEKILPGVNWEEEQDVGYKVLMGGRQYIVAFLALVVMAPICEEAMFRGWLYGKLRSRMKALPAILLVSLAFGIVHLQWNVGVTVFVMSVFMCIMRELTGSIYAGILLHMIKNGLAFYLLFVSTPYLQF